MQPESEAEAMAVVRSEKSMAALTHLHNQRLQAPQETLTMPIREVATHLSEAGEPHGQTPDGQIEIIAATLLEDWLPRMDALRMLAFDKDVETVTATPATSLQWLVIRPDLACRLNDDVATAAAWTAARIDEWVSDR